MLDKLIDGALRNRLMIVVMALLAMVAGYWSYRQLPVDAFPDVSPNSVQVFTQTEGLAPEEVEKYVTYPVERAMMGLPGLDKVRSVSNFGLSVVNIYFQDGMDMYFCRQLVNERLQEAREGIPQGFGEPQMGPISTGMGLVLFYYLEDASGRMSLEELRGIQDWAVKFSLQTVPGVTEVLGIGGFEKQFQVEVRPEALLRYRLTLDEVIEKIKANNLNVGAQFIEKGGEELVVRSEGLALGVKDLQSIVVKTEDGRPVYLTDVAEVKIGGAIRRGLQTLNGEREVVAGMVVKLYGSNASTVIDKVERKIDEINRTLPQGVRIVPYYQQKDIVKASVSTVTDALAEGVGLVTLIILAFMGALRPSLVVAIAIPFSVLLTFLPMRYLGLSANLMSLGGLAIAIGMMVDGAIVMVENVDRLLREADARESRLHVVGRACREVGRPIFFAVTIIIIVFLPLFTLEGVEGKTFKPLAYSLSLAMLASLIFAIFLAPVLSSLLMRRAKTDSGQPHRENTLVRWLSSVYRPVVTYLVGRRTLAVAMAAAMLLAGVAIFPFLGSEFTPRLREGTIVLRNVLAPSISLEEAKRTTMLVEKRLLKIPEVEKVISRVGRGEVGAHADPINQTETYVILKPKEQWRTARSQEDIEEIIRKELGRMPGVVFSLTQPIEMTVDELLEGVRGDLAVKVYGDDLATLKEKAEQISAVLNKIRGASEVQVDQVAGAPQLLIRPNREALARNGLSLSQVQETIRSAVGGVKAGQVFEGVRRYDIFVRFPQERRATIDDIREILVTTPSGSRKPLGELADIREVTGPRQITREDNQRFISIQCNVVGRDIGSFVEEAQRNIERAVPLPAGYFTTWGGQFRLQQEANRRLAVVVPITLLIIGLLLYGAFNSFKNALLILLNIPLALVGGVAALWISGQNLSVPASVGFISLFGIAVQNGLVLISHINQLLRDGMPVDEASVTGGCVRLRPVLMTASTAALGLIPLLLATGTGSEVQRPLATVVIGGLVTSTALTLLVLPALYKWFAIPVEPDVVGRTEALKVKEGEL